MVCERFLFFGPPCNFGETSDPWKITIFGGSDISFSGGIRWPGIRCPTIVSAYATMTIYMVKPDLLDSGSKAAATSLPFRQEIDSIHMWWLCGSISDNPINIYISQKLTSQVEYSTDSPEHRLIQYVPIIRQQRMVIFNVKISFIYLFSNFDLSNKTTGKRKLRYKIVLRISHELFSYASY